MTAIFFLISYRKCDGPYSRFAWRRHGVDFLEEAKSKYQHTSVSFESMVARCKLYIGDRVEPSQLSSTVRCISIYVLVFGSMA